MLFKYRALKNNKIIENKIEADSRFSVVEYLQKNDFFPIEITEVKDSSSFTTLFNNLISFSDIVDFTRQISMMVNAGLTLVESLTILKKQATKPLLIKLIDDILETVKGGGSFSQALKKYPKYFSNLYIALIKSGEASGQLDKIMLKLADNLEKEREFKSKLKGALIYPVIILIGMAVVVFIMITFVIPKLLSLYKDFNVDLPLSTKILIAVSNFFVNFWPLILIVIGLIVFLFNSYFKSKSGRYYFDKYILKVPVIGRVISISSLVDLTRTLAILIGAGVSILDALSIVIETTDNVIYQQSFQNILKKVEKGQTLGSALDEEKIFPPILVQMTLVGEETGNLDDTLLRLSKYFEMESEIATKTMTTLIEPLILVVLGVGVGFLVMSVITPIYNLTSSFK